jgi:hypothetical protein
VHTGFSLSLLAPAKLTVKGLQRPAPRIGLDKLVAWALISQQSCSSSRRPQASSAELTIQLKTVLEKERLNCD